LLFARFTGRFYGQVHAFMKKQSGFCGLPQQYRSLENSGIVILPVPYNETGTWLKGSDKGPAAIIEASANLEWYDIETDSEVYKEGIYTAEAVKEKSSPEGMVEAVRKAAAGFLEEGKFTVVIGGEHTVSIGPVGACVEHYGNISVLQLDAHSDLRDCYNGSRYNHACVTARIRELAPVVQAGIRSMDVCEKASLQAGRVFFAKDIYNSRDWIEKVVNKLTDRVYITIDLDVFDISVMASVGTPEPGGLFWYDVLALLRRVFEARNVVGFDVVELCPQARNKAPDFLAAKLIYKLLSYKFKA